MLCPCIKQGPTMAQAGGSSVLTRSAKTVFSPAPSPAAQQRPDPSQLGECQRFWAEHAAPESWGLHCLTAPA